MTLPFPVIVGVPRSGTTMLRLMLDAHPELAIPPETGFLMSGDILQAADRNVSARLMSSFPPDAPAWNDYGIDAAQFLGSVQALPAPAGLSDVLRLFYATYAKGQKKSRGGDKTPNYLRYMPEVASILPEAHFIHIVRDGRDVALSWSKTWFAPSKNLPELVKQWASAVVAARSVAPFLNYLEVDYDDLVRQPEAVLRKICSFIQLDFRPEMLASHLRAPARLEEHKERRSVDGQLVVSQEQRLHQQWRTTLPPQQARIGVWRSEMSAEDEALCRLAAGGLLNGD